MQAASGEEEGPHPQGNPPHPEIKIKAQTLGRCPVLGQWQWHQPVAAWQTGFRTVQRGGLGVLHGLHQRQP